MATGLRGGASPQPSRRLSSQSGKKNSDQPHTESVTHVTDQMRIGLCSNERYINIWASGSARQRRFFKSVFPAIGWAHAPPECTKNLSAIRATMAVAARKERECPMRRACDRAIICSVSSSGRMRRATMRNARPGSSRPAPRSSLPSRLIPRYSRDVPGDARVGPTTSATVNPPHPNPIRSYRPFQALSPRLCAQQR